LFGDFWRQIVSHMSVYIYLQKSRLNIFPKKNKKLS
jgi:hypothetical protein